MKLLIINGPNLNLLGKREPGIYGKAGYDSLVQMLMEKAEKSGILIDAKQSNSEGEIVDFIQEADGIYDGIILNPGAYGHYSYAIHDALKAVTLPCIEVHISNIAARESFRRETVTSPACIGQISGLGLYGYIAAVDYFLKDKG